MGFGVIDPSPCMSRPRVPVLQWPFGKKSEKSDQPSGQSDQPSKQSDQPSTLKRIRAKFTKHPDPSITPAQVTCLEGALRSIETQQPMRLIRLWRQVYTMAGILRSHFWVGGAKINRLARRVPPPGLLKMKMAVHVSVFHCGRWSWSS